MNRKARKVGQKSNFLIFIFHQLCHFAIVLFFHPSRYHGIPLCVLWAERKKTAFMSCRKKQRTDFVYVYFQHSVAKTHINGFPYCNYVRGEKER